MNSNECVKLERPEKYISVIRLNRPEKLNAMNAELMSGIADALTRVGQDNSTRVVIMTGEGRGFCSGLDLDNSGVIPNIDGLTVPRLAMRAIEHFSKVVPMMRRIPQPIIAAVNGVAYGGGFCLTLGADVRICADNTVFNSTGIVNGLTSTELGVSWLLPRLIGASRSNEILLTGRNVGAQEAERIGLVSETVPADQVLARALDIASAMCKWSPHGLAMTKQTCWANLEVPGLEAAMELENRNQIMLGITTNLEEKKAARRDGREAIYQDIPSAWPQDWGIEES
tara:strand:- start:4101 stop:4952 length:852 start_codon:yes stop_codon:yes gene_type:complete